MSSGKPSSAPVAAGDRRRGRRGGRRAEGSVRCGRGIRALGAAAGDEQPGGHGEWNESAHVSGTRVRAERLPYEAGASCAEPFLGAARQRDEGVRADADLLGGHEGQLRDGTALADGGHEEAHGAVLGDLDGEPPDVEVAAAALLLGDLLHVGAQVVVGALRELVADAADEGVRLLGRQGADALGEAELGRELGRGRDHERAGQRLGEARSGELGVIAAGRGEVLLRLGRLGAGPGLLDGGHGRQVGLDQQRGVLADRDRRGGLELRGHRAVAGVRQCAEPGDRGGEQPGARLEVRLLGRVGHPRQRVDHRRREPAGAGHADDLGGHRGGPVAEHEQGRLVADSHDAVRRQQLDPGTRAAGVPVESGLVRALAGGLVDGGLGRLSRGERQRSRVEGRGALGGLGRRAGERPNQRTDAAHVGVPAALAGEHQPVAGGVGGRGPLGPAAGDRRGHLLDAEQRLRAQRVGRRGRRLLLLRAG